LVRLAARLKWLGFIHPKLRYTNAAGLSREKFRRHPVRPLINYCETQTPGKSARDRRSLQPVPPPPLRSSPQSATIGGAPARRPRTCFSASEVVRSSLSKCIHYEAHPGGANTFGHNLSRIRLLPINALASGGSRGTRVNALSMTGSLSITLLPPMIAARPPRGTASIAGN
jgi:hypothetical protein